MQLTAVYCCVRVLSEAVAGLPLITYRYGKNGTKERATDHPLYLLLHDEPNPEMTSFSFRETLMTHLLLYGNAYAQIIRNGKGDVVALYPLMPDRMKVDRDEHGHIYYEYMKQQDEAATMKTGTVILKPEDVLHIPGLGFDGLVGYSPIAMAKNAIGMASACEEYVLLRKRRVSGSCAGTSGCAERSREGPDGLAGGLRRPAQGKSCGSPRGRDEVHTDLHQPTGSAVP